MMLYAALGGLRVAEPLDQCSGDERWPDPGLVSLGHLLLDLFGKMTGPATTVEARPRFQKLIPHRTSSSAGAGLGEFGDVADQRADNVGGLAVGDLARTRDLLSSHGEILSSVIRT